MHPNHREIKRALNITCACGNDDWLYDWDSSLFHCLHCGRCSGRSMFNVPSKWTTGRCYHCKGFTLMRLDKVQKKVYCPDCGNWQYDEAGIVVGNRNDGLRASAAFMAMFEEE